MNLATAKIDSMIANYYTAIEATEDASDRKGWLYAIEALEKLKGYLNKEVKN